MSKQFPDWRKVQERKLTAGEVRRDFIHSHGITLQALGRIGNGLFREKGYGPKLSPLREIDWSRSNAAMWEGRALSAGRVSKSGNSVILTTNLLKQKLGLPLTPEEQKVERAFERGRKKKGG